MAPYKQPLYQSARIMVSDFKVASVFHPFSLVIKAKKERFFEGQILNL